MSGSSTLHSDHRKAVKVKASKRTKQLDQIKRAKASANVKDLGGPVDPDTIVENGEDILSWTKISKAKRFRDTAGGGPEWKSVVRRTTYDAITGSVLDNVAYPAKMSATRVFARLPGGRRRFDRREYG